MYKTLRDLVLIAPLIFIIGPFAYVWIIGFILGTESVSNMPDWFGYWFTISFCLCILYCVIFGIKSTIRKVTKRKNDLAILKPDRSSHIPNFYKTEDKPYVDIGWYEGTFSNGLPYRAECWAEDGITLVTFFFSRLGNEDLSKNEALEILSDDGILHFENPPPSEMLPYIDASNNEMWSITATISADEKIYAYDTTPLKPHSKTPQSR